MSILRILFALALLGGVLLGASGRSLTEHMMRNSIERAYSVLSQCSIYAVIVVRRDGTSAIYNRTSQAPPDIDKQIAALPEDQRVAVIVPCPGIIA